MVTELPPSTSTEAEGLPIIGYVLHAGVLAMYIVRRAMGKAVTPAGVTVITLARLATAPATHSPANSVQHREREITLPVQANNQIHTSLHTRYSGIS
jgi:hypothetical protein